MREIDEEQPGPGFDLTMWDLRPESRFAVNFADTWFGRNGVPVPTVHRVDGPCAKQFARSAVLWASVPTAVIQAAFDGERSRGPRARRVLFCGRRGCAAQRNKKFAAA